MKKISKKFNKYLESLVKLWTGDTPTLSIAYEHYKDCEIKGVDFLVNSETMSTDQKMEYLQAVKKTLDANTQYAMYKLSTRQKAGEIVSTYEMEKEADDNADSLFIA